MKAPLFADSGVAIIWGCIFTVLLASACASDIRTRRIPNRLVGIIALAGFVFTATMSATPLRALAMSVAGVVVGFVLWIPFYAVRWLGAGDVKLFAAAGAWLGPLRTAEGALVAALVGGLFALFWMLKSYGVQGTAASASLALASPRRITNHPVDRNHRRALPYGVALSAGAAIIAWFPNALGVLYVR